MRVCPSRPRQQQPPQRMRCRMHRSHRRSHRRPHRPRSGQTTRRASRCYRCPARQLPTRRPRPPSPPPHHRPRRTPPPRAQLSGTEADRSDPIRNLLPASADATSAVARFSLALCAIGCNACRRREGCVMPPVPGRPERSRAESGARQKAMNGVTKRGSRHSDSPKANLAGPYRPPVSLPALVRSRPRLVSNCRPPASTGADRKRQQENGTTQLRTDAARQDRLGATSTTICMDLTNHTWCPVE